MNPTFQAKPSSRRFMIASLLAVCAAGLSLPAMAERATLKYKSEIALKASPQKAWDSFKTFGSIQRRKTRVCWWGKTAKHWPCASFRSKAAPPL